MTPSVIKHREKYGIEQWISKRYFELPKRHRALVFLDRDDTLIRDLGPTTNKQIPRLMLGLVRELRQVSKTLSNEVIFVISTNQSRIEKGESTIRELNFFHSILVLLLALRGVKIHRILTCPHSVTTGCVCRKPKTAHLCNLIDELDCKEIPKFFIGNATSDIKAGLKISAVSAMVILDDDTEGAFARVFRGHEQYSTKKTISSIILEKVMGD